MEVKFIPVRDERFLYNSISVLFRFPVLRIRLNFAFNPTASVWGQNGASKRMWPFTTLHIRSDFFEFQDENRTT